MLTVAKAAASASVGAGCLVFGSSYAHTILGRGAPFVPTSPAKIRALFGDPDGLLMSWLRRQPSESKFVDLGSGDGSLLRAATRGGFKEAVGYELNPWLAGYAELRASASETVLRESLWFADVHDADVVYVFGHNAPFLHALGAKLRAELPEGALVVSNAYEMPSHCFGSPCDVRFVETREAAVLQGLRDTSSHLFCYVQTAETRASPSWQRDANLLAARVA